MPRLILLALLIIIVAICQLLNSPQFLYKMLENGEFIPKAGDYTVFANIGNISEELRNLTVGKLPQQIEKGSYPILHNLVNKDCYLCLYDVKSSNPQVDRVSYKLNGESEKFLLVDERKKFKKYHLNVLSNLL